MAEYPHVQLGPASFVSARCNVLGVKGSAVGSERLVGSIRTPKE